MISIAHTFEALLAQGLDRLDAQLLMLHVLGRAPHDRAWLLAHDTDTLSHDTLDRLKTLVERRLTGEPLAYLVGSKEFYGLALAVDARVLVPRPDTETLVDWALALLTPLSAHSLDPIAVLDLGTGSGAIALALKASQPQLSVNAIDFSAQALAVARANAERLKLDVQFSQGSWLSGLTDSTQRFHLIVSNPPYIAAQDEHLSALTHEPLQALASGADGLTDLRHIIRHAPPHLLPGGWLLLEHGYDQAPTVRALLQETGFTHVQSRPDLSGIERCSGGQWSADHFHASRATRHNPATMRVRRPTS